MHQPTRPIISSPPPSDGPPPFAFAAVVGANVALAFGAWFVRLADTGPVAAAFWRMTLAAPILLVAAFARGGLPVRLGGACWALLALAGLFFAADLGVWHIGILETTLANATLFGNSAILIFPIYGFLIARSWPTGTQAGALVLAGIGAALLMGRSYQLDPRHLIGDLLCVLAGILYTVYFIVMARVRATVASLPALALATVASVPPLLLFALALGETIVPHHWSPLIALALVSQVIGQGLMIYALGQLTPLIVGIALLVQPLVAAAVGWIVYRERLGAADLIGAALVGIALVLVRRVPAALAPAPADTTVIPEETR